MTRYFEDFPVGLVLETASRPVTRAEIISFAAEYDPQPFHLDERAAAGSMLGGLAASGWHMGVIFMRLMCDAWLLDTAGMGSPGMENIRWLKPLRPDELVHGRTTVLEARASASKPDRGILKFRHELVDAAGDTLMVLDNTMIAATRPREAV